MVIELRKLNRGHYEKQAISRDSLRSDFPGAVDGVRSRWGGREKNEKNILFESVSGAAVFREEYVWFSRLSLCPGGQADRRRDRRFRHSEYSGFRQGHRDLH